MKISKFAIFATLILSTLIIGCKGNNRPSPGPGPGPTPTPIEVGEDPERLPVLANSITYAQYESVQKGIGLNALIKFLRPDIDINKVLKNEYTFVTVSKNASGKVVSVRWNCVGKDGNRSNAWFIVDPVTSTVYRKANW